MCVEVCFAECVAECVAVRIAGCCAVTKGNGHVEETSTCCIMCCNVCCSVRCRVLSCNSEQWPSERDQYALLYVLQSVLQRALQCVVP